jgi:mRNA-degrading endonuclease RelE of RelBE toxin-antitoxin system
MKFEIEFTDNALQDYRNLDARWRAVVKDALETHLRPLVTS